MGLVSAQVHGEKLLCFALMVCYNDRIALTILFLWEERRL